MTQHQANQYCTSFCDVMNRILFILIFLFGTSLFSQDYERIDATILLYPTHCETPEELSKFITRDFFTEEEKVRAIYSWMIQNIAYEPKEYKKFDYRFSNIRERNEKEEVTRQKIINRTLQKGTAVCEGYAFLFEKLCELQGITNYLVRGDTKTTIEGIGEEYTTSHVWNVALINGKPYLFDPTWGAGKYQQKFIKGPNYFYYKTAPELFEDAFFSEKFTKKEFSDLPLIIDSKMLISDIITPKKGVIFTEVYFDEIQFEIKNANPNLVSYSYNNQKNEILKLTQNNSVLKFSVPLELEAKKILIYFDDLPVLGYLIK